MNVVRLSNARLLYIKILPIPLDIGAECGILCVEFLYIDFLHIAAAPLKGGDVVYYPLPSPIIECLILAIVREQDSYGYEISQTIKLVAAIKESTLYPILKKLEQNGYLETYSQAFNNRTRKYYHLTDAGRAQLDFLTKEWQNYSATIAGIIEGSIRHEQ